MGELIAALVVLFVPAADRCDVLAAVDVVRAHAWAEADTAMLSSLYADDAGASDVAHLMAWRDRGITVRGARTIRASCHATGSGLEVVERLGPMVAVLPDGSRRALPAGGWNRRTIELVHDGRWRIARVR